MVPSGTSLLAGGSMGVGLPIRPIDELLRQGKRDLPAITNGSARPGIGMATVLLAAPGLALLRLLWFEGVKWAPGRKRGRVGRGSPHF